MNKIMDIISGIKSKASKLGACDKLEKADSLEDLANLLFSPQGVEFCEKTGFPDTDTLRPLPETDRERHGVFLDTGIFHVHNLKKIAVYGNTVLNSIYDGDAESYEVLLMHGAKAVITASGYAVVSIHGEGEVSVNRGLHAKVSLGKKIKEV